MTDLAQATGTRPAGADAGQDIAYEDTPFPERGDRRPDLTGEVTEFYTDESAALDEARYEDWLALLATGFIYQVPVPLLREDPKLPRHSECAMVFEATRQTLAMKLGRVGKHYAWSDRPGATLRHFVSGVRVFGTRTPTEFRVEANVLATWNRGWEESTFVTAARQDVLRRIEPGRFEVLRRRVLLDAELATYQQLSIIV